MTTEVRKEDGKETAEQLTEKSLTAMEEKRWSDSRESVVRALSVDLDFVPALLLFRTLRNLHPLLFTPSDLSSDDALKRAQGCSPEQRARGKRFVQVTPAASASRQYLAAFWAHRMEANITEALLLYRSSADRGCAAAEYMIAWAYENAWGVLERDLPKCFYWYRRAADQGIAWAANNLGRCFEFGWGTERDAVQAFNWYLHSAQLGNSLAMNNTGSAYAKGEGVERDFTEAVVWFRRAAEQGVALSQVSLGFCLESGLGTAQDLVQAARWYLAAADSGNAVACFRIGSCLENGRGVPANMMEAVKWYRSAAASGSVEARQALDRLEFAANS